MEGGSRIVTIICKYTNDYYFYVCLERPKIYLYIRDNIILNHNHTQINDFLTKKIDNELTMRIYMAMICDYIARPKAQDVANVQEQQSLREFVKDIDIDLPKSVNHFV
jgi:hypothetical protein